MENETQRKSALQPPTLQPQGTPDATKPNRSAAAVRAVEIGGPTGPEPTRYGDWERRGRCIDF
jgi:hypothetical protein